MNFPLCDDKEIRINALNENVWMSPHSTKQVASIEIGYSIFFSQRKYVPFECLIKYSAY